MAIMAPLSTHLTEMAAHESVFFGVVTPQQCQAEHVSRLTVCPSVAVMRSKASIESVREPFRGLSELRMKRTRKDIGNKLILSVRAATTDDVEGVAGPAGDSVVGEVAVLEEEPQTPGVAGPATAVRTKRPGVLKRGGTLSGTAALGKDPSASTIARKDENLQAGGMFEDPRWVKGTWDLNAFTKDGKVNWDSVIDAEVERRKWLEENPEASSNDEPVVFDTSIVPWWAWVKRFHLPEAELLNGRAAMVGYFAAYVVDSLTGVGLVDQQNSFLGKLLIFISVLGILLVRRTDDIETLKALVKESTFYDKQWQASWKEAEQEEKSRSE